MSKPESISGVWRGSYFYDIAEQRPSDGGGVDFELRLTQTFWQRLFRCFTGTVIDDPSHGLPGTGTIRGEYRFPSIRFTKEMPIAYITHEGDSIPLRESLLKHGYDIDCDFPHPPVLYEGTFHSDHEASGTWVIEADEFSIAPGITIGIPRNTGTWTLKR